MMYTTFIATSLLAAAASAIPLEASYVAKLNLQTSANCPNYTIINTRATGAKQGQCASFVNMNEVVLSSLSGGDTYATKYPASTNQKSASGSEDIVNYINETLKRNPSECFILQGYSQGAAATTNALKDITGAAFDAVKGVLLFGNPNRQENLTCNFDQVGGSSTFMSNGSGIYAGGIPADWVNKTMDICALGDGVCDPPKSGWVINAEHQEYGSSASVQAMGLAFVMMQLRNPPMPPVNVTNATVAASDY